MRSSRVETAVFQGCLLHGIVRADTSIGISLQLSGAIIGFGTGSSFADAISAADQNLESGGWYKDGAARIDQMPSEDAAAVATELDAAARRTMRSFTAWWDGTHVAVRLHGIQSVAVPREVIDRVMNMQVVVPWASKRGYAYQTAPDPDRPMAGCIVTTVCSSPNNVHGDDGFGLRHSIMKMGYARGLWGAFAAALAAAEFEIPRLPQAG